MEIRNNAAGTEPLNIDAETGLTWVRQFAPEGVDVWDTVEWETRNASIGDAEGNMVFEQNNVEIPTPWSLSLIHISEPTRPY